MNIVTAAEMRTLDERATSDFKIPSLLLMENAARGMVDEIEKNDAPVQGKYITIIAGCGNNGGDGLAAARHLRMRGASVMVYLFSKEALVRGDAKVSLEIWQKTGGALREEGAFTLEHLITDLSKSDFVIDAFLGTGLSHAITGRYSEIIEIINRCARRVIACDIPSGISADTGEILGVAIRADATITMAMPKRGHFMQEGLSYCGRLSVIDIGFPKALIESSALNVFLMTPKRLRGLLQARVKGIHKGTMGHLLVVAGSSGKQGAPQMTSLAALRSGAGLVTAALPKSIEKGFSLQTMEVMTLPLPETKSGSIAMSAEKRLIKALEGKTALAIGPGLSQHPDSQHLVLKLVSSVSIPMVIDADGINALAVELVTLKKKKGPLILTPHPGEMGRLIGKSTADVQKNRFNIAAEFAKRWHVILVLKDAHTIVAFPDGRLWVNNTGNPGMATAGMGDALTGMIAGFIAQGLSPEDAVLLAVFLHGKAGDFAALSRGEAGLLTSDLIDQIPQAIIDYLKEALNKS